MTSSEKKYTCYSCDSSKNNTCLDDFNEAKRNATATCQGVACFKRKLKDHKKDKQYVIRGCKLKLKSSGSKCNNKKYRGGGPKTKHITFGAFYCNCQKDFCNNANKNSINYLLLSALSAMNVFYKIL